MSIIKLFSNEHLEIFNHEWHDFLNIAKDNANKQHLSNFFNTLKEKHPAFISFTDKELSNKLIASRRTEGEEKWPNLSNIQNYIPPKVRGLLKKAHQSALLAIGTYNNPSSNFRSEGFIVMILIAWTSLFHAIFIKKGLSIKYKEDNYYELRKCIKKYEGKNKECIQANLEFLIEIRDIIVHRGNVAIDDSLFGYCQACILNFEDVLLENFGCSYKLPVTLAFSLQLSQIKSPEQIESYKRYNNTSSNLNDFIKTYNNHLTTKYPEVYNSQNYCFRVYMVPVISKANSADIFVEYLKYDSNDPQIKNNLEKVIIMIKENKVFDDQYKPTEVCNIVAEKLGLKDKGIKFSSSSHHAKMAKHFKIREGYNTEHPEQTNKEYCLFHPVFNQYTYTKKWIDLVLKSLQDDNILRIIYPKKIN